MPGGNHFQPSEWVKLILILAVAKYFFRERQRISWSDFMRRGALSEFPCSLVLAQTGSGYRLTSSDRRDRGVSGRFAVEARMVVALLAASGSEPYSSLPACTY